MVWSEEDLPQAVTGERSVIHFELPEEGRRLRIKSIMIEIPRVHDCGLGCRKQLLDHLLFTVIRVFRALGRMVGGYLAMIGRLYGAISLLQGKV